MPLFKSSVRPSFKQYVLYVLKYLEFSPTLAKCMKSLFQYVGGPPNKENVIS